MEITSECSVVAELLIMAAPPAVCAAGIYLANPGFCGPLWWLNSNPSYKKMVSLATEKSCDVAVEVGPKYYKILLRDTKRRMVKVKKTNKVFNSYEGIWWLMRYLSGY
jgi:hypothetical protein